MPKRRKFISVDEKCRVCLGEDGCMSDIFSEVLRPKINDLGHSTSIHIKDDEKLPRNICHVCLYKLDMWIEFKAQFVRSHTMLREHLEASELSDNAASMIKRKHSELQECTDDKSLEHADAKKSKSDEPTAISTDKVSPSCDAKKSPTRLKVEPMVIDDTSPKNVSTEIEAVEKKQGSENTTDTTTVTSPLRQITGRRSKTTERRKASTKRWVARKKALLAATGENDTDTDSMSSDDGQLSPVQKARAKCNAERIAETQRRMAKELKNLESNITDYYGTNRNSDSYIFGDTDSDSHRKDTSVSIKNEMIPQDGSGDASLAIKNNDMKNTISSETEKLPPSSTNEITNNSNIVDNFLPHTVRSVLMAGDVAFIITSTLVLTEPHYINPVQANDGLKDSAAVSSNRAESTQERNTDIIDAVQLRRVTPKSSQQNDKRFIQQCLNIEVEGTELEALQRVQSELTNYVEKEMQYKFSNAINDKSDTKFKGSSQTLDQQLKTIVEKTIMKNLETSSNDKLSSMSDNRGNNTFTGEFVKAALKSKVFQPNVILNRLDATSDLSINKVVPRNNATTNTHAVDKVSSRSAQQRNIVEAPTVLLGKRRSVQPAKFADYDRSPFNTDSDEASDVPKEVAAALVPKSNKVKTYGPASAKQGHLSPASNQRDGQKSYETIAHETPVQTAVSNATKGLVLNAKTPGNDANSITVNEIVTKNITGEKHICGVCGEFFGTRKEVEVHFGTHKSSAPVIKQVKQKMMRCKRCHEIVEARYVKLHVCHSPKNVQNVQKCHICEAVFRSEKLLVQHLETHKAAENVKIKQNPPNEEQTENNGAGLPKECAKTSTNVAKKRNPQIGGQAKETYTCFVCDKIFDDEEVLKDHLQKHCDDISEDDQSPDKELYQCAICGESLVSEDALESHVEKHLFDDEDDNPNLISIGSTDPVKTTKPTPIMKNEMIHSCGQCSETFDSEMLLMLHMQAHEEEVAIAEWERRRVDNATEEQHVCVICDEIFSTEVELSEHLDIHNGNAHICLLCEKPFLTLEELQCHVNTHG